MTRRIPDRGVPLSDILKQGIENAERLEQLERERQQLLREQKKLLRSARHEARLSLSDVAAGMGRTKAYASQVESDTSTRGATPGTQRSFLAAVQEASAEPPERRKHGRKDRDQEQGQDEEGSDAVD